MDKKVEIMKKRKEKALNSMSDVQKTRLNRIERKLKKDHDIKDMLEVKNGILIKYIENLKRDNGKEYSDAARKGNLFVIKEYYKKLDIKFDEVKKSADEMFKKMLNEEMEQLQTEKEIENYLTYDELNILLEESKNYKTTRDMYKYLILASICMDQPPIRPQIYGDLNIVDESINKDEMLDENGKKVKSDKNYLVVLKESMYIYINDDKVGNYESNNKSIKIMPKYEKVIRETLKKLDRKKLFEYNVVNVEQKLLLELQEITKNKFTFDMARSSYINHWNSVNKNASDKEKIELAGMMRHSYETHLRYYKKINPVSGNLKKMRDLLAIKEKKGVKNAEYQDSNNASSVVSIANKRGTMIKDETMIKHGITYDEKTEQYVTKKKDQNVVKNMISKEDPKFKKSRSDKIRYANLQIINGINFKLDEELMKNYGIVYNNNKKIYEIEKVLDKTGDSINKIS
jgi:integrase